MLSEFRIIIFVFLSLLACESFAQAAISINPLKPPDAIVIDEARQLVTNMITSERGPYQQIRWFCADGSIHPPRPYACAERGGGKQYAQYSEQRRRLAELGWHVGSIYTANNLEYWVSSSNRNLRLRELALEKYLMDIDDGWILKRAKHYRGRVQAEDEELIGRRILTQLLSSPAWVRNNYLLLRELVRIIPHGAGTDLNRSIRRLSLEVAEQNPDFELLRIEIHTTPSVQTIKRVENWLNAANRLSPQDKAIKLLSQLVQLYGENGRQLRLNNLRDATANLTQLDDIKTLLVAPATETDIDKVRRLGELLTTIRNHVSKGIKPAAALQLMDSVNDIEAELRITANQILVSNTLNRRELLSVIRGLLQASYGGGLLSTGEQAQIIGYMDTLVSSEKMSFAKYKELSIMLNLSALWAIGSIRYTFAEALNRYTALDNRAAGFTDDVLRSSPMLQLAELSRLLLQDVQLLSGVSKTIRGNTATSLLALNPGIAIGPLRILSEEDLRNEVPLQREEIVVLPQTVSELTPIAGVMTLGEGNLLSHVQLLARNFGIPNISITAETLEQIKPLDGKRIALIAGSDGSVVLEELSELSAELQKLLAPTKDKVEKLVVPQANLQVRKPIPISELKKELSGKLVGPKAANLGELNRLFPGKVASAIALPFGFFLENVNRHTETNWQQLGEIYQQHRDGKLDEQQLLVSLTNMRNAVAQLQIEPAKQQELITMMRELFGEDGSYGIFLRSDTNVEDLPGFTGAGLSETVANVVGLDQQIKTIPTIWASVLSPRAIAWRSNLLSRPEHVYPSVLLMKSVPSEKSGVLITADMLTRKAGITASTAWGVGGAVAGEATESVVLLENGDERLISEAKTPYQRFLSPSGGVEWLPAADGPVLSDIEKQQLRLLAKEVDIKYPPLKDTNGQSLPWDIEFGFVDEKLKLFQIRALVERGQERANRIIRSIHGASINAPDSIELTERPLLVTKSQNQGVH